MEITRVEEWRILHVDDDEDDFILTREMLSRAQGRKVALEWARTLDQGREMLSANRYDAVLVDYDLGAGIGTDLIRDLAPAYPAPFILYTGRGSYDIDLEAMQAGATLYLTKNEANPLLLERFIRYAIEIKQKESTLRETADNLRAHEEALRAGESRFRASIESMLDGFVILTAFRAPDGEIVDFQWEYVNQKAAQFLGHKPEELIGSSQLEMNPRFRTSENFARAIQVLNTGEPVEYEELHFQPGSESQKLEEAFWVRFSKMGDRLVVTRRDITAQKQMELSIRSSEEQLRAVIENLPVGLVVVDPQDKTLHWNRAALSMHGYQRHEDELAFLEMLANRYELLALDGQSLSYEDWPIHHLLNGERFYDRELVVRKKDQDWQRIFSYSGLPIQIHDRLEMGLLTIRDVTHEKEVEGDLRQALAEAQASRSILQALMEYIPEGITIADGPDVTIRMVSRYGEEILGGKHAQKTAEQVATEWQIFDADGTTIMPTEDLPLVRAIHHGEVVKNLDLVQVNAAGQHLYLSCNAGPILDEAGKVTGGVVAWREVSDRKQAEQALRMSEERFTKAFDASPNAIVISRQSDGLIEMANNGFERLFGYHRAEILDHTSLELNMFADPNDRLKALEKLKEAGVLRGFETRIVTKAGEVRDVSLSMLVIRVGSELSMVTVIQDITDRKRAEEATQSSIEREQARADEMETLMDTVPAMIWISHDPACREMIGNRYGYEFLRMWQGANISKTATEEDLQRQPYRNFKNGREIPTEELPMQIVASTGVPVANYDFDLIFNDGTVRTVLGNVNPLFDANGNASGAVAVFMDITDRREVEEKLQRYAAELERSNQALQDFASIASHDLQEPLRKVQAFGRMLETRFRNELSVEGQDYIARITSAASRMKVMIDGLLAYSRITSKAQPFEEVDLNTVVSGVLSDLEVRLMQTGGRVDIGPLPTLEADPLQLRQLLQNLMGNALKYHRPDVTPLVRVTGKQVADNMIEIRVQDNGLGFEMQYAERIFTPFTRLNRREGYEGSGIGLAICQKIVDRHGGAISAQSVPGEGSTFTVILPKKH